MHIYLRMLIMGQPGVEVGDAGVEEGVARDEGGLGGAGLVPVVVVVIFILGSFEIPLGECAAPGHRQQAVDLQLCPSVKGGAKSSWRTRSCSRCLTPLEILTRYLFL